MSVKRQNSAGRAVSEAARVAANHSPRLRVHKPAETDPQKRAEAVREAGSIIKTTARIDTITLGWY
jgi:hypothetical protein